MLNVIDKPILTDYARDIESDLTDHEKEYVFTYNSFEDFKVKSQDALKFSNAILDSSNTLDSECAYKGLDMIADHLNRILTSQ